MTGALAPAIDPCAAVQVIGGDERAHSGNDFSGRAVGDEEKGVDRYTFSRSANVEAAVQEHRPMGGTD